MDSVGKSPTKLREQDLEFYIDRFSVSLIFCKILSLWFRSWFGSMLQKIPYIFLSFFILRQSGKYDIKTMSRNSDKVNRKEKQSKRLKCTEQDLRICSAYVLCYICKNTCWVFSWLNSSQWKLYPQVCWNKKPHPWLYHSRPYIQHKAGI